MDVLMADASMKFPARDNGERSARGTCMLCLVLCLLVGGRVVAGAHHPQPYWVTVRPHLNTPLDAPGWLERDATLRVYR